MKENNITINDEHLHKLTFGSSEDAFIVVSDYNAELFDQFVHGYKAILTLAEKTDEILNAIPKEDDIDYVIAVSAENVKFSKEAIKIIDAIFGEGTVKRVFADTYALVPNFIPNSNAFLEFFKQITPYMEEILSKHIENRETRRKNAKAKYKPVEKESK